jgi:disulfide oxidoreductase YuzD
MSDERREVSLREIQVTDPVVIAVFDLPAQTACFSGGWGPSWSPEEITAIVRAEIERRYGDDALVLYYDIEQPEVQTAHSAVLTEIDSRGLLFPVTVIDGVPVYDGAVSYPAIMRAVNNKLLEREVAPATE